MHSLESFDFVEVDGFTSMPEDTGTQFLLDDDILFHSGGRLRT